jgi:hypothetical protein
MYKPEYFVSLFWAMEPLLVGGALFLMLLMIMRVAAKRTADLSPDLNAAFFQRWGKRIRRIRHWVGLHPLIVSTLVATLVGWEFFVWYWSPSLSDSVYTQLGLVTAVVIVVSLWDLIVVFTGASGRLLGYILAVCGVKGASDLLLSLAIVITTLDQYYRVVGYAVVASHRAATEQFLAFAAPVCAVLGAGLCLITYLPTRFQSIFLPEDFLTEKSQPAVSSSGVGSA